MPAQARLALTNMEQVLAQVGATMGEVVAMI
jgi:enamine deaminase RidA (YjgF/YER057c/UK114 family)